MTKFDFKNIIKKFSKSRGRDKLKIQFSPYRDWGILLIAFFVLLVIVAIANAYLFIQISNEEIFAKDRAFEEEVEMLDIEMLKNTIEFFDVREEHFNSLLKQKPEIIDPSL